MKKQVVMVLCVLALLAIGGDLWSLLAQTRGKGATVRVRVVNPAIQINLAEGEVAIGFSCTAQECFLATQQAPNPPLGSTQP